MFIEIEKSCLDHDGLCDEAPTAPHFESMTDSWHPALRLLIIVGGATILWALLLSVLS